MPELVVIDAVTKRYGGGSSVSLALDDVSLRVEPGEFVSIMGPSGCGKSTLLNLIAGYDPPSSGRVVVAGNDLWMMSEADRSRFRAQSLGFVVQNFDLLPRLTVAENVLVRLGPLGVRGLDAQRRAGSLLDKAGVPAAAWDRYPSELSGGEQQRVALARALVAEPALILADEPTGNLDSTSGAKVLDLLRDLNQEQQAAVILVTHDAFAATIGHRTITMRDGAIIQEVGSLEETRSSRVRRIRRKP